MGRPREFDTDKAMQGAMTVFWRQGYKATSLPELLEAMGLSRGSFYKAFRDKESVFLQALDRYDREVVDTTVAMLAANDAGTAWECLSMLFQSGGDDRRGCFICNAMVELGPDHPEVARKTNAMADRLRAAIRGVLERYRVQPADQTVSEMADLILHLYFGHQAMGKAGSLGADWPARLRHILDEGPNPDKGGQ